MGLLVDGIWRDEQPGERTPDGRFVRPATRFRNWVTEEGGAGPTGEAGFPAARFLRPGFASLLRSPESRVSGAPRDVRVLGGTPVGRAVMRQRRA